ncbi:MAG TPA: hypothetical protein VGR19_00360 [Allosphingosinicella sp.]|nr:hypothetical protein [Allosphingosinicella sp.]
MSGLHAFEEARDPLLEWGLDLPNRGGLDQRREADRAYRRWTAMLRGRICPSIEDLEPAGVAGPRDLLMDLRHDPSDPELVCAGGALIADCGRRGMRRLSDVPAGSFLSLLAAHCRHVTSTRHPIAFEGEEAASDGRSISYRAILLPLSSDGETVDFVYGTIGWHEAAGHEAEEAIWAEVERSQGPAVASGVSPIWPQLAGDGPQALQSA